MNGYDRRLLELFGDLRPVYTCIVASYRSDAQETGRTRGINPPSINRVTVSLATRSMHADDRCNIQDVSDYNQLDNFVLSRPGILHTTYCVRWQHV